MRRHLVHAGTLLLGLATFIPVSAADFYGLDIPADYSSYVTALSPDGSVVMGEIWAPQMPREIFRWAAQEGLSRQADIPGWGGYAYPYAMSYDGSTVVAYSTNPAVAGGHAFTWKPTTGRVYLDDPLQVQQSEAWGVSYDGSRVVGYRVLAGQSRAEAVIWQDGLAESLGQIPGSGGTYATGIASTGTIVGHTFGGAEPSQPFRWTPQAGIQTIALPGSVYFDPGLRISADGRVVVGHWGLEGVGYEAFVWREGAEAFGLGDLPGGGYASRAAGVSADGQIVVGSSVTGSYSPPEGLVLDTTTAFIWDQSHGIRSLPDLLTDQYGLDLHGWELTQALGISADGQTIVGQGIDSDGFYRTWIVQIPEPGCALMLLVGCLLVPGRRKRHDAVKFA